MKQSLLISAGLVLSILLSANMANAQCTGSPASGANGTNNNAIGTLAWAGLNNTQSIDGLYATATPVLAVLSTIPTKYLQITGFGFVIPPSYTMCGISATISRGHPLC